MEPLELEFKTLPFAALSYLKGEYTKTSPPSSSAKPIS